MEVKNHILRKGKLKLGKEVLGLEHTFLDS